MGSTTKPEQTPRGLVPTDEAAQYLGVSTDTLLRMKRQGKIQCVPVFRSIIRWDLDDLDDYIAAAKAKKLGKPVV